MRLKERLGLVKISLQYQGDKDYGWVWDEMYLNVLEGALLPVNSGGPQFQIALFSMLKKYKDFI
jgi:hypothetical protein